MRLGRLVRKLVAIALLLAAGVAVAQVKYAETLQTHKGEHFQDNFCYLVGFDLHVNQWYGVCQIVDRRGTATDAGAIHREIVYWDSTATEKGSKPCDKECPEKPVGNLTTFDYNGTSFPLYVVGTDATGVIGGNSTVGNAMLAYPWGKKFEPRAP